MLARLREKLLAIGASRAPDFVIGGALRPYLHRWYVIPRNHALNIYLHKFIRSDDDRALHDHPWLNCSIILAGAYVEHIIEAGGINRRMTRRVGDIVFRRAKAAHRIEINVPSWSLFITGPVVREWGFHCPNGWRAWREFVAERDSGQIGKGCA